MNNRALKVRKIITLILSIIFYFIASDFAYDALIYFYIDFINVFKDIFVTLPLVLLYSIPPYLYISYMLKDRDMSFRSIYRRRFIDNLVITLCSGICLFTLLLACFIKYHGELISNQFMSFFPLNIILISFVVFSFSIVGLFRHFRIPKAHLEPIFETTDYIEPKRNKKEMAFRISKKTIYGIFIFFAMILFGQSTNALTYFDFSRPINYLGQIAMIILFALPSLYLMTYIYGYARMKDGIRKRRFYRNHLFYLGALTTFAVILLVIGTILNPQFMIQSMGSTLLFDFAATYKINNLLILIFTIIPIILATITYRIRYHGKRKI